MSDSHTQLHNNNMITFTNKLLILIVLVCSYSQSVFAIDPETGWWWNENESGRGFSIEQQGNNIFFATYLYDDSGKPSWYTALLRKDSNKSFSGNLQQFKDGQTLFGSYQTPSILDENAGEISLNFSNEKNGTLSWPGGTVEITRFIFGSSQNTTKTGWWWNGNESGRGYSIEKQGDKIFFAAYLYDSSGNPTWYTALLKEDSNLGFVGNLQQFSHGQTLFGDYQTPVVLNENAGELALSFSDNNNATITWPGGTVEITRFLFGQTAPPPNNSQTVLILYDDGLPDHVDNAILFARQTANLIGGIDGYTHEIRAVSGYTRGEASSKARTIYLGTAFDSPIPDALLQDTLDGNAITWVGYNIWNAFNMDSNAEQKLGFKYIRTEGAFDEQTALQSYNLIDYNGYIFNKKPISMDIAIVNPGTETNIIATARKPSGSTTPYALQKGNFWYIADNPFLFIHERDRYLVFADLLPKMLGINQQCSPNAIIRVEDVKAVDTASQLNRVFDAFNDLNIPFGIATIPLHVNSVTGIQKTWAENNAALETILNAQQGLGEVLQHGYTHQYEGFLNPTGLSAADWEFWNINTNQIIPEMTSADALTRVLKGKEELLSYGLTPVGWVTPHYAANPDYYADWSNNAFSRVFERRTIRSNNLFTNQFFPYPVRDIFDNTLVAPENTNFISTTNRPEDILEIARANLALSCPWVGMFFHSHLMVPGYTGSDALSIEEFKSMLTDIQALGYSFKTISSVELNGSN